MPLGLEASEYDLSREADAAFAVSANHNPLGRCYGACISNGTPVSFLLMRLFGTTFGPHSVLKLGK